MRVLTAILMLFVDLFVALSDALAGRTRRRYETTIFIHAPRDTVWRMLRSRDITYDGLGRMRVLRQPLDDGSGRERNIVRLGDNALEVMLRLIEEREPVALQYELLTEGTTPQLVAGNDDFTTYVLHEHRGGTQLDLMRELTPTRWINKVLVPLGLRGGAHRYKVKAEQMAAEEAPLA